MNHRLLSLASAVGLIICVISARASADDWQQCAHTEATDRLADQLIANCVLDHALMIHRLEASGAPSVERLPTPRR